MFEKMGYKDEPMPEFESRYPGKLEACLAQPFSGFGGTLFYRGVLKKAVALFYFCIKDHPFENGNKRFAVSIFMYCLIDNGYWLKIGPVTLYEIAKVVADSEESPQEVIAMLTRKFKPLLEKLEDRETI